MLSLGILAGCGGEVLQDIEEDGQELVSFQTCWETADPGQDTRTVLQEGGCRVLWSPSDVIKVYKKTADKTYFGRFTSDNDQPASEATFYGHLFQGGSLPNMGPGYWAVYPGDNELHADYRGVQCVIPCRQTGQAGSFGKDLFPAMARCGLEETMLSFYLVCGGARFSVTQEGVTRFSIRSKGGEALSGSFCAGFGSDGKPVVNDITEGIDSVEVIAPEGGFLPGKSYFAVLLPQTLSQGVTVRLTKDYHSYGIPASATFSIDKTLTVKRAGFGLLDSIDRDLTYTGYTPTISEGIIPFADEKVKARLVKAFDTDQDGEISYAEAAAASSLEGVFGAVKTYKSFDEFQFFVGITAIPDRLFMDCPMLTSVTPPPGLRVIGAQAFKGCSSLQSFLLPASLETIGTDAFSGCTALADLTVGSFAHTTVGTVFADSPIQRVSLSATLPDIPDYAFDKCKSLTDITIPESVTSIGRAAFKECSALRSVSLPPHLASIGSEAFAYCNALSSLSIPETVTRIEDRTFQWCTSLADLETPVSLQYIGEYAFSNCEALTSISIPSGQTRIEKNTFYKCASLTQISFPEGLTAIDEYAFYGCTRLASRLIFPESVSEIGKASFAQCVNIPGITLPTSLERVEDYVFQACTKITAVYIPDPVTYIGEGAFSYCGLLSVHLPVRLEVIGPGAFTFCSFTSVVLPDGTRQIGENAFASCTQLERISIPESVTLIGNGVFKCCSRLERITLPETISVVSKALFRESGLVSFTVPESVSVIEDDAFNQCANLKSISIPESVTSIRSGALSSCPVLETLDIPSSVQTLDRSIVTCIGLKRIILRMTVPPRCTYPSFERTADCPIYVPDTALDAYRQDAFFSQFAARIRPLSELAM